MILRLGYRFYNVNIIFIKIHKKKKLKKLKINIGILQWQIQGVGGG